MVQARRIPTMVDWLFAPEWLTLEQACALSGWSREAMQEIIALGGVDQNGVERISRDDLLEFDETLAEVLTLQHCPA